MLLSFHSQYYSELMTVKCTEFLSTDREVMLLLFHSQYYLELTTVKCTEFLSTERGHVIVVSLSILLRTDDS